MRIKFRIGNKSKDKIHVTISKLSVFSFICKQSVQQIYMMLAAAYAMLFKKFGDYIYDHMVGVTHFHCLTVDIKQ